MQTNLSECQILRHWYRTRGCDAEFTESTYKTVLIEVQAIYFVSGFPDLVRIEVIEAYIRATSKIVNRAKGLHSEGTESKPKKQKKQKQVGEVDLSSLLELILNKELKPCPTSHLMAQLK